MRTSLFLFFFSLTYLLHGCSERENIDKISIHKIGDLGFRRSYASLQFGDLSISYVDSINKSNPAYSNGSKNDSLLLDKFKRYGILDSNYGLIRDRFIIAKSKSFDLFFEDRKLSCHFRRPDNDSLSDRYNLVLSNKTDSISFRIDGHYGVLNEDIKYMLLDLLPGGFKEIVILNEYYIMMGDNSDLIIYEVR